MEDRRVEREHRVRPLELFFDLVFVFAITQVTGLLSDDPTWGGLLRGLLILDAVLRFTPTSTAGPALIVTAGFLDGGVQLGLWATALALDYGGVLFAHGLRVS